LTTPGVITTIVRIAVVISAVICRRHFGKGLAEGFGAEGNKLTLQRFSTS
jgi:hypothetical protein